MSSNATDGGAVKRQTSLLMAGVTQRVIAGVAVIVVLWLAVAWALSGVT